MRAAPLAAIGWFPTESITEDFLLSLKLTASGWHCRYHGHVLTTGEALSIGDLGADARAAADVHMRLEARGEHMLRGYDVHSLLIAPVVDADGTVIGMIELVNKDPSRRRDGRSGWAFTKEDERLLGMLCSHCAIFLRNLE